MAVIVNEDKCINCGECVLACPCDVLRLDAEAGVCVNKYPEDCQLCHLCVYYCPSDALELTGDKDGKLVLSWS